MAFVGVPYHAQREKQNSYREFPNLIDSTKYNYYLVWQRGWGSPGSSIPTTSSANPNYRSNKGEKPRENPLTLLTERIFMFPGQWFIDELEIWILTHPRQSHAYQWWTITLCQLAVHFADEEQTGFWPTSQKPSAMPFPPIITLTILGKRSVDARMPRVKRSAWINDI